MDQRKDIFIILGLVFIVNLSYSQENVLHLSDNLHVYKIEIPRKDHSLIETYVSIRKEDEALCPKPVILLLQGSGANSVFAYKEDKIYKPFLFKEIYQNREPERELFGHTYKRWLSFSFEKSLDDLLKVEAPIFLGIGSSDRSAPPHGSDIVIEEFIKAGKDNITYKNYVGFDHAFMKKDKDKTYYGHSEILVDILEWIRKTRKTRDRHRIKAGDRTPKTVNVPNNPR